MNPLHVGALLESDRIARKAALWDRIERPRSWLVGAFVVFMGVVLVFNLIASAFNPYINQLLIMCILFLGVNSVKQAVQIRAMVELLRMNQRQAAEEN